MHFLNDNGTLRPATHAIHDAGAPAALFGDGVFETVRYLGGGAPLWPAHWARLSAGVDALLLPRPAVWSEEFFHEEICRTVDAGGWAGDACRVRVQVYATAGAEVRYAIGCGEMPRWQNGIALGISTLAVKDPGPLAHLKTCNALPYRIAAREAAQNGWDDAVLLNSAGSVVETTRSNIFLAQKGTVFVNGPADGCIAGVMRAQLVAWMRAWGHPVEESSFTASALYEEADEIFVTNALRGVVPVRRLFLHNAFGERTLNTTHGEALARMVEQKFIDFRR